MRAHWLPQEVRSQLGSSWASPLKVPAELALAATLPLEHGRIVLVS
jgi:hypothetical protein